MADRKRKIKAQIRPSFKIGGNGRVSVDSAEAEIHRSTSYERGKEVSQKAEKTLAGIDQTIAEHEQSVAGLTGTTQKGQQPLSPAQIAAAEQGNDDSLYRGEAGQSAYSKAKRRFWTRKRAIASAAGGGSATAAIIAMFIFVGPFKVPAIVGSFEHDLPGGRMTRLIVEKPFKKMVIRYLVAKKAGNLALIARPGSVLGRVYKMFDAIQVERLVKERTDIEAVRGPDGKIRIHFKGKDLGVVDSSTEALISGKTTRRWAQLEKANKAFGRSSGDIARRAVPIFRVGTLTGGIMPWTGKRFAPPQEDKAKSPADNVTDEVTKPALEETTEEALKLVDQSLACLDEGKCDGLDRSNRPVDVTDPNVRPRVEDVPTGKADSSSDTVQSDGQAGVEEAKKGRRSFTQAFNEIIVKRAIKIIDIIGWIDLLADLQHIADEVNDKNLFRKAIVLLREYQALAIAAAWLGYSDNIKDSKMPTVFTEHLSGRLTGSGQAAMTQAMYGTPTKDSVPVETKIGSGGDDLKKDFYANVFGVDTKKIADIATCKTFIVVNGPACVLHAALWVWRSTLGRITGPINDFLATAILYTLPQYWITKLGMAAVYGDDWEAQLGQTIMKKVATMFGFFGYDPTASGPKLVNSIGVGTDVMYNRYMETNLGAREVTNDPNSAIVYHEANANYHDGVASLPLKDRLFASDIPGSLVNRLAIAAPTRLEPSSLMASILAPIKSLPSTIMSFFTGKSMAADTAAQRIHAVDGVGQFGGNAAEVDADIPAAISQVEVENIQDLECPANASGFFNNCQRYKEIGLVAMCFDAENPCPQWRN